MSKANRIRRARRNSRPGGASRPGGPRPQPGPSSAIPDELIPDELTDDCWFDDPDPASRSSWAVPPGHGTYQGMDVDALDPHDQDQLPILMKAMHPDFAEALEDDERSFIDEPFNPRLHITIHTVVATQLLNDDPPETWLTVKRLAGLGYDWHNIMHMIGALATEDIWETLANQRKFDPVGYVRRLGELPGDWPPPSELDR